MLPMNSIGELCEGKLHAQFDEEAEVFRLTFIWAPLLYSTLHAQFDEEGEVFSLVSLCSSPLLYPRGGAWKPGAGSNSNKAPYCGSNYEDLKGAMLRPYPSLEKIRKIRTNYLYIAPSKGKK